MSKHDETAGHEYILVPYSEASFLLRRSLFVASLYSPRGLPVHFGPDEVQVFDLDALLIQTFGLATSGTFPLVLVMPLEALKEATKALLVPDRNGELPFYAGFRLSTETKLVRFEDEIRPWSPVVAPGLERRGLLGCHFASQSISYWIDPEALLHHHLDQGSLYANSAR